MRSVARKPQRQAAVITSTPAPYKGLNDVAPLSEMDSAYAITLDNWICSPSGPTVRQGNRKQVTGFTDPVTSFLQYRGRTSTDDKLFAVSSGAIYDVTSPGTVGDAVHSGLSTSSVYWQYTQQTFTNASANYMVAVNGTDPPVLYNGSWITCTQTASPANPGEFALVDNNGNSVTINDFNDAIIHQQRLWFVYNHSTVAYYCDIAEVGGNLYAFDFGPLFPRGGYLHKLATWTMNTAGVTGVQPVLVAISSNGDVVIFQGNDPNTAQTWDYVATYQLATPVGKRCTVPLEGELLYFSLDGLYQLSKYVATDRVDSSAALSYTISNTLSAFASEFTDTPGFEMCVFPGQNLMVLNVPQATAASNLQYVFHTITQGWSRITGWPALCFTCFRDQLYFGTADAVCQAFVGYTDGSDSDGTGGSGYVAQALTAFTAFPDTIGDGVTKVILSIKPYITTGQIDPSIAVGVNVDFDTNLNLNTTSASAPVGGGAVWDEEFIWDSALWAGLLNTFNQWFSPLAAPGNNFAVALAVSVGTSTTWSKTQWRVKGGYEY